MKMESPVIHNDFFKYRIQSGNEYNVINIEIEV